MLEALNLGNSFSSNPICRKQCLVTNTKFVTAKSPFSHLNDSLQKDVLQSVVSRAPDSTGSTGRVLYRDGGKDSLAVPTMRKPRSKCQRASRPSSHQGRWFC